MVIYSPLNECSTDKRPSKLTFAMLIVSKLFGGIQNEMVVFNSLYKNTIIPIIDGSFLFELYSII